MNYIRDSMYDISDPSMSKPDISKALKLLKIHKKAYLVRVNGGILRDHFMSLKHGLTFLGTFLDVSGNEDLIDRIEHLVSIVKKKLHLLRYLGNDQTLFMNLEQAYADLTEQMKNVIIEPGTNEYDLKFPEILILPVDSSETSLFLREKIKKLVSSNCKVDQIAPMMKELEDISKMLTLLNPIFEYADEFGKENKIYTTIASVIGRATCFIYMSAVGKMDDEMVLSMKNGLSGLIIEEAQIMEMYLTLDIYSTKNLASHISMSLRLLEWNKRCYLGAVMGAALEDHFMSIKHGLQFLDIFLKISKEKQETSNLTLRIQQLVVIVKHKLFLLPHNHIGNSEHAYGELREEMQNVIIKPGTNDFDTLFPENLERGYDLLSPTYFLLQKIVKLVTSSCKCEKIAPMMKELEEFKKKLTSLITFFDYFSLEEEEEEEEGEDQMFSALITFVDRAMCLIYLSFVGKLNEDMLVSVRKNLSLLIEETEIKEMCVSLGIIFEDDLDSDIDLSLSLLKRQEEYHIETMIEVMLKDHIMSMKNGIEFLKWFSKIYTDRDLDRRIIMLAGNVKQKLESLTHERGGLNRSYGDLRDEMKNVIINPATNKWYTLLPEYSPGIYHYDFLVEKITTLITSNCKADQMALLKKELLDLRKILTFLKPLGFFNCGMDPRVSTLHHKGTFLIYLSFVGKMDIEEVLSVKSSISVAIMETDVQELYTMILNKVLYESKYLEAELYLLENVILLLKSNFESLNDACSTLYKVLICFHSFLLGLSPNVLLRKLHLLQPSFNAILGYSIPIICSCYMVHTEVDISAELKCVLDLVSRMKSEFQEFKLYYFPRADDLGFLEFFTLDLEDLMKIQEISLKEEIEALHFEVDSLLSLAKTINEEEFNRAPWNDIINMSYQAEYIIDHYLVTSSRDLGLISSLSKIIEQLQNIRTNMQEISCKSLKPEYIAVTSNPQVPGKTTQGSDTVAIVGFQDEARIMEDLLKGENKLDVISIVGMAGVGKTTLTLSLYKDPCVVNHFDNLAWCTVSKSYQYRDVLLSILDQVNPPDQVSNMSNQALADHLCRSLKRRRYLIVLDDVWDTTLCHYLKPYLPDDKGNRILITTRNKDVADQIGSKVNELHGLSNEKSWELFQKKILQKESLPYDLLRISKRIVRHCEGLPLSIVIIAGILSDIGRTKKRWNEIAKSVSSLVLSDPQGKCKIILELSYNHLRNQLRSCFLYLGSFPENKEISVNRLTSLWIAEGIVRGTKSDSAEEVVKKYLEDLIAKNLVIPAKERSRGGVKTFRLHALLRDFCLDKAKKNHFFALLDKKNYSRPLQDPRRLIINGPRISALSFSCHSIRSMICFSSSLEASEIEMRIGSCDMVLLKVLEVGKILSNRFPDISNLVHLRYLAMGLLNWEASVLPSLISKLENLEILILKCRGVIKVPDSIWDMVKLRHVGISREASLQVNGNRLENSSFLLENLRSLSNARVSSGDSMWLNKLTGLQRLGCIFVNAPTDNHFQKLIFYGHLTSLKVENQASGKQRFQSTCQFVKIL